MADFFTETIFSLLVLRPSSTLFLASGDFFRYYTALSPDLLQ